MYSGLFFGAVTFPGTNPAAWTALSACALFIFKTLGTVPSGGGVGVGVGVDVGVGVGLEGGFEPSPGRRGGSTWCPCAIDRAFVAFSPCLNNSGSSCK